MANEANHEILTADTFEVSDAAVEDSVPWQKGWGHGARQLEDASMGLMACMVTTFRGVRVCRREEPSEVGATPRSSCWTRSPMHSGPRRPRSFERQNGRGISDAGDSADSTPERGERPGTGARSGLART